MSVHTASRMLAALLVGTLGLFNAATAAEPLPPPSQWQWPEVARDPALQRSIIEGGYTEEELRNIHEELRILSNVTAQRAARPASGPGDSGQRPPSVPGDGRAAPGNAPGGAGAAGGPGAPGAAGARPMPPYMTADVVMRGRMFEALEGAYGGRGYGPEALGDRMNQIESLIAKGDRLWMVWQVSGKHVAPLFGFPPTGKLLKFRTFVMLRFRDGKISEMETRSDDFAVYQQLGGQMNFPDQQATR